MPLVLKQLGKRYATGVHAVREIDLEVRDGEFFTLLGPSGCGKTTTLRMIAGLERADVRAHHHRRAGLHGRAAPQPRRGDGLPELRALPAHERV